MSFTDTFKGELMKGDFKTEKRPRSKFDDIPKSEEKKVERKKEEKKSGAKKKEKKEEKKEEKKTKKVHECKSLEERKEKKDEKNDGRKTPMQVTVAKALETINVNPVALLVSKMIDQQSLVVKLLTEARESRRFEPPERTEEMVRMRDKVRHLEKQLRFLEVNLDRKCERGIWKTESTQTEYGVDHSTNTADVKEPKVQIPLRNRPTCTIS